MPAAIVDRGRGPEIDGTRITIYDVFHYVDNGRSAAEISEILHLTAEETEAALTFIDAHRDEVLAVHREIEERIARGNPPELQVKLDAAHVKFQKKLSELRAARSEPETNGAGHRR